MDYQSKYHLFSELCEEIIEIEVTANDLIKASVIDFDGENENIAFLHADGGDVPANPLYKTTTNHTEIGVNAGSISDFGNKPTINKINSLNTNYRKYS